MTPSPSSAKPRRQAKYPNLRGGGRRATLPDVAVQKARYLQALAIDGTLTTGCRAGGVNHGTVYTWRETDDHFVLAENQVKAELADRLEAEALRRAYTGWDRPIYQRGVLCGTERVYSDMLLKLMLGALKPEKFRERVDVSGTVEQIVRQVAGFNASEVL
jgi:hypothetical protein